MEERAELDKAVERRDEEMRELGKDPEIYTKLTRTRLGHARPGPAWPGQACP